MAMTDLRDWYEKQSEETRVLGEAWQRLWDEAARVAISLMRPTHDRGSLGASGTRRLRRKHGRKARK